MRAWLRYFLPRKRWMSVPKVLVETLTARGASPEELLLIKSGRARNTQHARELMIRHNTSTAAETLKQLPPIHRGTSFSYKLGVLFLRLAGHDERNPFKGGSDNRIPVKYRFGDKD